ncbi:MAG: 50S ribosomal protein L29 [Bacteroidota bacterium]|jgi:large subunit ribosomal protein L29
MKQVTIKELSTEELSKRLAEEQSSLERMRLNHAVSPLENPLTIRHSRKLIARLNTEITKRKQANA